MSIHGFQFSISGVDVTDAYDGALDVQCGTFGCIGFSMTGAGFSGCGTLVELELDGVATGLSNITISDPFAVTLPFEYFDGSYDNAIIGCVDENACNYNPEATMDDASCEYPRENYDCNGNCLYDYD